MLSMTVRSEILGYLPGIRDPGDRSRKHQTYGRRKTDDEAVRKVVLNFSKKSNIELLEEVSRRFGKERMMISISDLKEFTENQELIETYADSVLALDTVENASIDLQISIVLDTDESSQEKVLELLGETAVSGLCGAYVSSLENDLHTLKETCEKAGIPVNTYKSNIAWSDFKLNSDGMVPVIVQDYRTDEVLMLAYMNELAFDTTLKLGKMTYWSRSRNQLWTKGLTSGHVQYVKSLTIDCDNDTILAKVDQVGCLPYRKPYLFLQTTDEERVR